MVLINWIYLIFLTFLLILNRGGAAIGVDNINTVSMMLAISPLYLFKSFKYLNFKDDFFLVFFVFLTSTIAILKSIILGISAESFRECAILLYPLTIFAGFYFTIDSKKILDLFKYLNFIFFIAIVNGLLSPFIKSFFTNTIIINETSLFGIYGNYPYITLLAFCWFSSGINSKINKGLFSILSAAASLISGSRAAMIGIIVAFITSYRNSIFRNLNLKKIINSILFLIIFLIIIFLIFPLFNSFDSNYRGDYSFNYFWNSFLSIFNPLAGYEEYGTSLLGSRQHRIVMIIQAIFATTSQSNFFLFGLPFDYNYTETYFNDPHNGYVSLFARGGIFVLTSFLFLLTTFIKKISSLKYENKTIGIRNFSITFSILSLIYIALHTVLTSPMIAIPFYFLLGFVWALNSKRVRNLLV